MRKQEEEAGVFFDSIQISVLNLFPASSSKFLSSTFLSSTAVFRQRGAALFELAIVVPLILFISFSVFEYGRNLLMHISVDRALYEGLKEASRSKDYSSNSSTPRQPKLLTSIEAPCNDGLSTCPREVWRIMNRITQLIDFQFKGSVRITQITLDYDVLAVESEADDLVPIATCAPFPCCQRSVRGEIEYEADGFSIFRRSLQGKTKARIPYFQVGKNEEGVICSLE